MTRLEHVNLTVADPAATAALLSTLFGWHIRWQGPALGNGRTIHVGTERDYIAVYSGPQGGPQGQADNSYALRGGLNHVGVVVEDLDSVERRVRDLGYTPHSHADYEPGRRFYFREENGIEFEVVSYD